MSSRVRPSLNLKRPAQNLGATRNLSTTATMPRQPSRFLSEAMANTRHRYPHRDPLRRARCQRPSQRFRRWLYLEDPTPVYVVGGTLVANRAPGDPVWTLLVCAPSTGKTEILSAATRLPYVIPAAKVTEASLLSGTSKRERVTGATGGLLRQVGDFGVLASQRLYVGARPEQGRPRRGDGRAARSLRRQVGPSCRQRWRAGPCHGAGSVG